MGRAIAKLVGALSCALVGVGIVFVVGLRSKSPAVVNAVRRFSRATKPYVLKSAGTPGAYASVVKHVGRTTGRSYETPVAAAATDGGFVIALPYGTSTDWVKNVLASGSATIVDGGGEYRVDQPEIVPLAQVEQVFSHNAQSAHHLFGVEECLRVRRLEPGETVTDPGSAS